MWGSSARTSERTHDEDNLAFEQVLAEDGNGLVGHLVGLDRRVSCSGRAEAERCPFDRPARDEAVPGVSACREYFVCAECCSHSRGTHGDSATKCVDPRREGEHKDDTPVVNRWYAQ